MRYLKTFENFNNNYYIFDTDTNKVIYINQTSYDVRRKCFGGLNSDLYPNNLSTIDEVQKYHDLQKNAEMDDESGEINLSKEKINDLIINNDWDRSFTSEKEAFKYITNFIIEFNSLSQKISLFRLLKLKDEKDFNNTKIGNHFVGEKEILMDSEFINSIGINEYEGDNYILEVEVDKKDINLEKTIIQRLLNSEEEEYFIDDNIQPKIIKIEKL